MGNLGLGVLGLWKGLRVFGGHRVVRDCRESIAIERGREIERVLGVSDDELELHFCAKVGNFLGD